jgi:hypothetical protein
MVVHMGHGNIVRKDYGWGDAAQGAQQMGRAKRRLAET